jgi:hypothetical protein
MTQYTLNPKQITFIIMHYMYEHLSPEEIAAVFKQATGLKLRPQQQKRKRSPSRLFESDASFEQLCGLTNAETLIDYLKAELYWQRVAKAQDDSPQCSTSPTTK